MSDLLRYYEALECASAEMLEAARAGDWDSVCRLEGACAVIIGKLRQLSEDAALPQDEQPHRMRILRAILPHDAEIRRLAEPLPRLLDARVFPQSLASQAVH